MSGWLKGMGMHSGDRLEVDCVTHRVELCSSSGRSEPEALPVDQLPSPRSLAMTSGLATWVATVRLDRVLQNIFGCFAHELDKVKFSCFRSCVSEAFVQIRFHFLLFTRPPDAPGADGRDTGSLGSSG